MQIPPRPDALKGPDRSPLSPPATWRAWEAVAIFFVAALVGGLVIAFMGGLLLLSGQ